MKERIIALLIFLFIFIMLYLIIFSILIILISRFPFDIKIYFGFLSMCASGILIIFLNDLRTEIKILRDEEDDL